MDDWEKQYLEREKAYDEAKRLASGGQIISNKNNPLKRTIEQPVPFYDMNMRTLHNDVRHREEPTHGKIYAGLMDNMRYGGNE